MNMNRKLLFVPFMLGTAALVAGCNNNNNTVKVNGPDLSVVNFSGEYTATKGVDYKARITPKDTSFKIYKENFNIKVSNKEQEQGWYFINNELTIKGNIITGDIDITVTIEKTSEYTIELDDQTLDLTTGEKIKAFKLEKYTSLTSKTPFYGELKILDAELINNYRTPDSITLINKDETDPDKKVIDSSKYTFNANTGEIIIPKDIIKCNFIVSVKAIRQRTVTFSTSAIQDNKKIDNGITLDGNNKELSVKVDDANDSNINNTLEYALTKLNLKTSYPRTTGTCAPYDVIKNNKKFNCYTVDGETVKSINYDTTITADTTIAFGIATEKTTFRASLSTGNIRFKYEAGKEAEKIQVIPTYNYTPDEDLTFDVFINSEDQSIVFNTAEINCRRYDDDNTTLIEGTHFTIVKDESVTPKKATVTIKKEALKGDVYIDMSTPTQFTAKFYRYENDNNPIEITTAKSNQTLKQIYSNVIKTNGNNEAFDHWEQNIANGKEVPSNGKLYEYGFEKDGNTVYEFKAIYTQKTFSNDYWSSFLKNLEDPISFASKYSDLTKGLTSAYGKTRKVLLNYDTKGEQNLWEWEVKVIGINTDKITSTKNNALFTFEFVKPLCTSTYGGAELGGSHNWTGSVIKNKCNELIEVFADQVEIDFDGNETKNNLKDKIPAIDKSTYLTDDASSATTESLKLFPLSATEMNFSPTIGTTKQIEGTPYSYYTGAQVERTADTWLRSIKIDSDNKKDYYVDQDGALQSAEYTKELGIAPAFCL